MPVCAKNPRWGTYGPYAVAMVVLALLVAGAPALGDEWTPDAASLLELVDSGRIPEAGELAAARLRGERDPALRRDLRAIIAIAALRQPERALRVEGQTQLYALIHDYPPLAARGECRLALGISALALDDTPAALEHLSVAANDLEARGKTGGFADALENLASAWIRHADWERTPTRFGVKPPAGPDQARAIRSRQIEILQTRAAKLPLSGAPARIALVTAIAALSDDSQRPAAEMALERLLAGEPRDRVAASAAMALAEIYDAAGRRADVLRVLKIAANSDDGVLAAAAHDRLTAFHQPAIEVLSPLEIAPGEGAPLAVRTRNIVQLSAEIRRIDLGMWLQERQGRFLPAQLATSGSAVSSHSWTPARSSTGDWWDSPTDHAPRLPHESGAYVLELRGEAAGEHRDPIVVRRLITVSNLRAAALVGRDRACVWAVSRSGQPVPGKLRGRFWMFGSFQPTKFELVGGIGALKLPGETSVLRDRRWSMLLEGDDGPLILQGSVAGDLNDAGSAGAYILTGAIDPTRSGDHLILSGALLRDPPAAIGAAPEPYSIVVSDAAGESIESAPVRITESGLFAAEVDLSRAASRRNLSAVLRRGPRSLANVAGRFQLPGTDDDTTDARLEIEPEASEPGMIGEEIGFRLRSTYPWRTAIGHAALTWGSRWVALPTDDAPAWGAAQQVSERGVLDDAGVQRIGVACEPASLTTPTLLGVWATSMGWDGRRSAAFRQILLGPKASHAWLIVDPPVVRASEPMRLEAGWILPSNAPCDFWPSVRVQRGDAESIDLPLRAEPRGVRTIDWRPSEPGDYAATLQWPREASAISLPAASTRFRIEARSRAAGRLSGGEFRARAVRRDGKPVCELEYAAETSGESLAAILLDTSDPIMFVPLDGTTKSATIPLRSENPSRVLFARWRDGRLTRLAEAEVESQIAGAIRISTSAEIATAKPGDTTLVSVSVHAPPDAGRVSVVARLVAVGSESMTNWAGANWRDDQIREASLSLATAPLPATETTAAKNTDWSQRDPARSIQEQFFADGQTIWTDLRNVENGQAQFAVPVPQAPGGYRLLLLAAAKDAAPGFTEKQIIARDGHVLRVFAPIDYRAGDRVQIAVQATAADPRRATPGGTLAVKLEAGGLLVFEAPAVSGAAVSSAGELTLQVPADGEAVTLLTVEAIRTGETTLRFSCPGSEANAVQQVVRITGPETRESRDTKLRVTRTLIRMDPTEEPEAAQTPSPSDDHLFGRNWVRVPIEAADERLRPGTVLLVREDVEISSSGEFTWQQQMPANCVSILERPPKTPEVAPIQNRRAGSIDFAGRVSKGRTTHEYLIVTTRSGSCEFPPPIVTRDGKLCGVEMVGGDTRLTVLNVK